MSSTSTSLRSVPEGLRVHADAPTEAVHVLSPAALTFVRDLVRTFRPRIEEILQRRHERDHLVEQGASYTFLPETRAVRESAWRVAPVPAVLSDRRVEITGPVDRKMVINALNSGARVFMADFEDATCPTWDNQVRGQANLIDAVRGSITFDSGGKKYALGEKVATLFVRPRGFHLWEKHLDVDGQPAPGSLFDFGLFFFHNAKEQLARGKGPFFYLPKLESHLEARVWNDVFTWAQKELGVPHGSVKATVLIETLPAAFEMDEILHELKDHSAGLNCGRWDYIFSFIKKRAHDPNAILPDRAVVTMDRGFLQAYVELLIQTCHKRGAHAMGGMAAQIPIKNDEAKNQAALDKVRTDKLREVKAGHDGTWVAHPGLVPVALGVFDEHMKGENQLGVMRSEVAITEKDLLAVPAGPRTEETLRHNIKVGVQYIESWFRGQGCVPLYDLMEDAATAEISRAQVWQWRKHAAPLQWKDGRERPIDDRELDRVIDEEMAAIAHEIGESRFRAGKFDDAKALFVRLSHQDAFEEFLTLPAYERILEL